MEKKYFTIQTDFTNKEYRDLSSAIRSKNWLIIVITGRFKNSENKMLFTFDFVNPGQIVESKEIIIGEWSAKLKETVFTESIIRTSHDFSFSSPSRGIKKNYN